MTGSSFGCPRSASACMGGLNPRSRRALVRTKTLETAIAAAAKMGESKMPKAGKSTPAATGISTTL